MKRFGRFDNQLGGSGFDLLSDIPEGKTRVCTGGMIDIDGMAIAKPTLKEATGEVIKQEMTEGLKTLSNIVLSAFAILGAGLKSMSKLLESSAPALEQRPDPVLLARVDDMWIEIGRWE